MIQCKLYEKGPQVTSGERTGLSKEKGIGWLFMMGNMSWKTRRGMEQELLTKPEKCDNKTDETGSACLNIKKIEIHHKFFVPFVSYGGGHYKPLWVMIEEGRQSFFIRRQHEA